ncbi:MAG: hypothetical protein QMC36_00840 [Patescibacteria group bacterium]
MPEIDSYVRNESWETGFLSSVPYRKGDVLELAFFAEFSKPYSFGFDWNSIFSKFDLVSLTADGVETEPNALFSKAFKDGSRVVMRLRAKSSGSTNADSYLSPKIAETSGDPASKSGSVSNTGTVFSGGTLDVSSATIPERLFYSDTNNAIRISGIAKGSIRGVVIGGSAFKGADFRDGYVFVVER